MSETGSDTQRVKTQNPRKTICVYSLNKGNHNKNDHLKLKRPTFQDRDISGR